MLAWVRLVSGLWWPGEVPDTSSEASSTSVHMPNLRIMKLFQKEMIPIDISQEETVHLLSQTGVSEVDVFFHLHHEQVVPVDQSEAFSLAVRELGTHLGLKKDKEVETPQQLVKTTKRTSAISWDNYFMAVAFLSAYVSLT